MQKACKTKCLLAKYGWLMMQNTLEKTIRQKVAKIVNKNYLQKVAVKTWQHNLIEKKTYWFISTGSRLIQHYLLYNNVGLYHFFQACESVKEALSKEKVVNG